MRKKSDALAEALAKALEEEARIESKFGTEPKEGSVVKFRAQFHPGGVKYRYAAIHAGHLWYTTGPNSPMGYTWDEFTHWLDDLHRVIGFKVVK